MMQSSGQTDAERRVLRRNQRKLAKKADWVFYFLFIPSLAITQHSTMTSNQRITYNTSSLWGNVFVTILKVGDGSFHFIDDENGNHAPYYSFEDSGWDNCTLDDDKTRIPKRILFDDFSFDEATQTFRATTINLLKM